MGSAGIDCQGTRLTVRVFTPHRLLWYLWDAPEYCSVNLVRPIAANATRRRSYP